jgi:kumamolisin
MPQSPFSSGYSFLPGHERPNSPPAFVSGQCDPGMTIDVSLHLRGQNADELDRIVQQIIQNPSAPRVPLAEFASRFGASQQDIEAVQQFASAQGLAIKEIDAARRTIVLSGSADLISAAFRVRLLPCQPDGSIYHAPADGVQLPSGLQNIVLGVFGLDNRPLAVPHFRLLANAKAAATGDQSYNPTDVAKFYNFPTDVTGKGETIGFIELGGGYQQSDLDTYFKGLGISPTPPVSAVSVDGGTNTPSGDPNSADGEVMLDIEVAGAVAPGAQFKVFFAPNSDQGFIDAVTTAIHDANVSIISISWGQAESGFSDQSRTAFNDAFQSSVALGKTIFAACGDNGSSDGQTDGKNHVDFPSSSPYVTGCGGTTLQTSGSSVTSETVWNEQARSLGSTGGGVSDYFPLPAYQQNSNVPPPQQSGGGRGVPDVAGDADPATGYKVLVDGSSSVSGGTSAVAPLFAGLTALINEARRAKGMQALGFANTLFYQNPQAFRDITVGNNGAFSAGPGWDPTTGLGSPNGQMLRQALGG